MIETVRSASVPRCYDIDQLFFSLPGSTGAGSDGQALNGDTKTGDAAARVSDQGAGGVRDAQDPRGDRPAERLEPLPRDHGRARDARQGEGESADDRQPERRVQPARAAHRGEAETAEQVPGDDAAVPAGRPHR